MNVALLVSIHYNPIKRVSSFSVPVTVDGNVYEAGKIISSSRLTNQKGLPNRRMNIVLSAFEPADKTLYITDHGPVKVEVLWVSQNSNGVWTKIQSLSHVGVLSGMEVSEEQATIIIETLKGTTNENRTLVMSDTMQRKLYPTPNPDRGFEYVERFRNQGVLEHPPPQ